jgi:hypothetical protein
MYRALYFDPPASHRRRSALVALHALTASIRRTADGVHVRFSDGRIAWLDKLPQISESAFLGSVTQWARQRGARTFEIEYA